MSNDQLKLGNQLCFPIYSASRLITKAYKPYLDQLGLTYPQYLVLLVLWEEDNIAINSIKERLMLDTNTLSPMLKRMERSELIKRTRSNIDERSVMIKLTNKGNELKKKALQIPEELVGSILTDEITIDRIVALKENLNALVEVLKEKNTNTK